MKSRKELLKTILKGLRPIGNKNVSEWASEYRIISSGNALPGKWINSRSPFLIDVMDAFTDSRVHRVIFKSASQVGKSECILNIIGRYLMLDPCAIMITQPTLEMSQDFSKRRIAPMLRDVDVLNKLIYEDGQKTRDTNQTILSKTFRNGATLVLTGANSPAGLSSRPIRILLCDEVDRFPASAGAEGDPISLASKRTSTYWNRKIGLFSTPTIKGESRIEREFELGTKEIWKHSCPNCGEFNEIEYKDMKIEGKGKNISEVRWKCPSCSNEFDEITMKNTLQRYIVENPDAYKNGIRSFYVNGFSSRWISWEEIVREYEEARGNAELERVVVNTRFGKTYEAVGEYRDNEELVTRLEEYGSELPIDVLLLTAAVDVQDNRLEYEICGWGVGEECWGIKKGVIMGTPSNELVWESLDKELDREYKYTDGRTLKVARTFVDSGGHFTSNVYRYCAERLHKGRFAIKGKGGAGVPIIDRSTRLKTGVWLVMLGVNEGKSEVYSRLKVKKPGKFYFHFPKDDKEVRGYDQTYFKGLTAEKRVKHTIGGKIVAIWEPISKKVRNEPLDLRVYNIAAMKSCRITDWQAYKNRDKKVNKSLQIKGRVIE